MAAKREPWRVARRCLTGVGLLALTSTLAATEPGAARQNEVAEAGRGVYLVKCASCHGEAGTGHGPESRKLRQPAPDLTRLSDRTRPFDRGSIQASITGRIRRVSPPSDEMPHFRGSLNGSVPAGGGGVTELNALLTYLETIQRERYGAKPGTTASARTRAGALIFAANCASCHGPDGRGLPAGSAPDLTTVAARLGGTIDRGLLTEWIAHGRHSDGAMPAWERVWRRAGWSAAITAMNLEAVALYVESIQR